MAGWRETTSVEVESRAAIRLSRPALAALAASPVALALAACDHGPQ
jgi:hypothetical protein